MGTANYDASRVTQRQRSVAMATFSRLNNAAVANGTSIRREQPDSQLGEILAQRNTSKAFFTPLVGNPQAEGCPCSQDVSVNAGGNNGNNAQ